MKRALTDAVQRALWSHMAAGSFRKRDLVDVAKVAGHPGGVVHRDIDRFVLDLRAKGAIYFTGEKQTGVWSLLPKDQWTGSPIPSVPVPPELKAPVVVGLYDPLPEIEGPNSGLTEGFSEHLWHDLGGGDRSYQLKSLPVMEQRSWREAGLRALNFLFELGFVGPSGKPRELFTGYSYRWLYEANTWEIVDEEGGYVAMLGNDYDIPLFLAAPDMAAAIKDVVERFRAAGAIKRSDIETLAQSLPVGSGPWSLAEASA